jgi:hypothetical protein
MEHLMKLTKSYLRKVIKEELTSLSEQPEPEQEQGESPGDPNDDKTAKRAGKSAVGLADEVVDGMLQKSASLAKRLEQLRGSDQRKLALARSVLVKIVGMDPDKIGKMLQLLVQGMKQ